MITLMLQMILLTLLMIANGEPLRFFLLRGLKSFSNLDFIQISILDIYLGGFLLYAIAMVPLGFFSWTIVSGVTVLCFFCSIYIHRKSLIRVAKLDEIKAFLAANKEAFVDYVVIFAMFLVVLLINLVSLGNLVFGSVRDESIHSLMVEVILENKCVPVTLRPYSQEGIIYPQASHIIFSFASYMLSMEVPKAVFYVSILFKSLSVFGAYFLGKKVGYHRAYYLGLSFVFAFISSWPLYIVWGGNPFLVGFPLFLVSLGLLFPVLRSPVKNDLAEFAAVGLLFGYVGTTVISYFQTLVMVSFFVFVYWLVRRNKYARRILYESTLIFLLGLLPLSPFILRFFAFYQYPGHNIGIPSDFSEWPRSQLHLTQALQWAFENLSPHVVLRVMTVLLLLGLVFLVWKTKVYGNVKSVMAFALAIFVAASSLSLVSFFLPADFTIISWGHQGIILIIPINILIVSFCIKLAEFCRQYRPKRTYKIFPKNSDSTSFATIALLLLITTPFLCYRLVVDPKTLRDTYGIFAVTTKTDYDLMTWMKGNLSSYAVILVNPYEAGLFIPSISYHRIVFPYSGSSFSSSYQTLVNLLTSETLNKTTYELMQRWNISHVFVGSNVAYGLENFKWNPKLFLGNPNFELEKNFGDAYLFRSNYTEPNVVFLDDFEYMVWDQNLWETYFEGNGMGNATIKTDFGYGGSRCLRITAQVEPTASEWTYTYRVRREIFGLNNSYVTLSFYFNATAGFDGKDTFAVLISNIQCNRSMVITTPSGIYKDYKCATILGASEGFFEFDLSATWRQIFNSSLPNPFILEFVNFDFDGSENVAYIDDVKVASTLID